jgi:hypothetical protein
MLKFRRGPPVVAEVKQVFIPLVTVLPVLTEMFRDSVGDAAEAGQGEILGDNGFPA